ncbi:kielin/chordin-like protein [Macrobrachium nipponense]|uniref:kielin/chordin-like protein n=1 Tax=Macrobrachium nipponense TaxID=159736 RepID=UPI0030C85DB1
MSSANLSSFVFLCLFLPKLIALAQLIPLDDPVCCFNATKHKPGSVVFGIEESCVNLVCAVDESRNPPAAVIVHVRTTPKDCKGMPCEDCYDTSCVDESGIVRSAGETWMPTRCSHCECTAGQVVDCKPAPVACEPQPNPSCEEIPGPCCPTWKCSDQFCVDNDGKRREINEEWGGPCIFHSCSPRGILTSIIDCARPPVLNGSCELFTPSGKCCPVVSCGCIDSKGVGRKLHEEWGGPCIVHTCTAQGVITRIEDCAPLPLLNSSCELFTPEGKCCPVVRCGCVDDKGIRRAINETWGTPCIINTCTTNGITTIVKDCARPPPLNGTCKLVFKEGQCCPVVSCGCVDANGISRENGSTWERGCTSFRCTDGKITEAPVNCTGHPLGNPPHNNCIVNVVPGKCCPEWVCGTNCALVRCAGPPQPDCIANPIPPLQCCATYTCPGNIKGCVDADGNRRAVGSTWEKGCTSFKCVEEGKIIEVSVTCPSIGDLGKPKHSNCIIGIPPKRCCPAWICGPDCALLFCAGPPSKDCVANDLPALQCCPDYTCPTNRTGCKDGNGTLRAVGSKWEKGCTSFQCVEEGNIIEAPIVCSSVRALGNPPHSNCIVGIVPGKCCPEWICGPNCLVVLCAGPPSGNCAANEIPPLECCPTYTCPEVTSAVTSTAATAESNTGTCKIGSTWIQDCLKHTCTAEGIVSNPYRCEIGQRPSAGCSLVLPPGKCCLEWQCPKSAPEIGDESSESASEIRDESELVIPIPA